MAQIHAIIEDLFGTSVTEEAVLEAFRVEHDGFSSHPMTAAHDGGVRVHGDFNTSTADCRHAGHFDRVLHRAGSTLVAQHIVLCIAEPFRQQGLATHHLRKAVRFYDEVGIEYVQLEAAGDGVIVWPQLGFELREQGDRKLLRERISRH